MQPLCDTEVIKRHDIHALKRIDKQHFDRPSPDPFQRCQPGDKLLITEHDRFFSSRNETGPRPLRYSLESRDFSGRKTALTQEFRAGILKLSW